MRESYNLLAIDPGSERSAFLWCRVEPPEEWALPFGVMPQRSLWLHNDRALFEAEGWPSDLECATDGAGFRVFNVAGEVLPGLYAGTTGSDQLIADQWLHLFVGVALSSRCAMVDRSLVRLTGGGECPAWAVYRSTARSVVTGNPNANDADVKAALIDIYGGQTKAVGGGRCKTCKRADGLRGREKRTCENCWHRHSDHGYENPRGPFFGWKGSHGWAALAVAIVAAQRIGRPER